MPLFPDNFFVHGSWFRLLGFAIRGRVGLCLFYFTVKGRGLGAGLFFISETYVYKSMSIMAPGTQNFQANTTIETVFMSSLRSFLWYRSM